MDKRSAPKPAPRSAPGARKLVGMNEVTGRGERPLQDPGPYQTGLDCSGGEQPEIETENLNEKHVVPPIPHSSTKPGKPRELISRCSEKNIIVIAALQDCLARQFQNNKLQDKKCFQKGNVSRESTVISDSDFRSFMHTSESFTNALQLFVSHLPSCASALERQHAELQEVAGVVDKTHKGVKIAGITGGATGAVGGAAAVAGILLSPVTLGASLAITALGVGVAAAGGVTGASAAITNKVKKNQVRKKLETILKDYQSEMKDIEGYLNNINTEMGKLREYDLQTLERVNVKSAKIARLVKIVDGTSTALSVMSRSSGVIEGFACGMDLFFTEEDSQNLKKESKTRFAQQIREVAGQIEAGRTELMDMREKLLSEGI